MRKQICVMLITLIVATSLSAPGAENSLLPAASVVITQNADKLVYADFENLKDKKLFSNQDGSVVLNAWQENAAMPARFKGLENQAAPEPVRLSKTEANHAAAFDFELPAMSKWAGVGMEIQGHPVQEGKWVADDVSGYKYLMVDVYATGVQSMRIEFNSRGQGLRLINGFPQMNFRVTPGMNTYKIELKKLAQPVWAEDKVSNKDLLAKLTSITLTAVCDQCTGAKGTVVIDNVVFLKS